MKKKIINIEGKEYNVFLFQNDISKEAAEYLKSKIIGFDSEWSGSIILPEGRILVGQIFDGKHIYVIFFNKYVKPVNFIYLVTECKKIIMHAARVDLMAIAKFCNLKAEQINFDCTKSLADCLGFKKTSLKLLIHKIKGVELPDKYDVLEYGRGIGFNNLWKIKNFNRGINVVVEETGIVKKMDLYRYVCDDVVYLLDIYKTFKHDLIVQNHFTNHSTIEQYKINVTLIKALVDFYLIHPYPADIPRKIFFKSELIDS